MQTELRKTKAKDEGSHGAAILMDISPVPVTSITLKSGSIECSYISHDDKENFLLSVPSGKFGCISVRVRSDLLTDLIEVLQNFKEANK